MRRYSAVAVAVFLGLTAALTSCSGSGPPAHSTSSGPATVTAPTASTRVSPGPVVEAQPTAPAGSTVASPGCGSAPVYHGGVPGWLANAAGGANAPTGVPYVMAHPALAGGFLFGYPLRAGHPDNPSNKILWAVRTPTRNAPLIVDAHPLGAPAPHVHYTRAADSGPGDIYPSIIDVPLPGCWVVSLSWATGKATVELEYTTG